MALTCKETGFHITFADGREVFIEFDGESYCDNSLAPAISEDVVFLGKRQSNRLRFYALVLRGDERATVTSWSLKAKDADSH